MTVHHDEDAASEATVQELAQWANQTSIAIRDLTDDSPAPIRMARMVNGFLIIGVTVNTLHLAAPYDSVRTAAEASYRLVDNTTSHLVNRLGERLVDRYVDKSEYVRELTVHAELSGRQISTLRRAVTGLCDLIGEKMLGIWHDVSVPNDLREAAASANVATTAIARHLA
ncbi:hypothetical protein [Mycobacteroides abscessus]|uniref:hypothetical protein n=1 Tax=Mycobacteroides abscessus TaxID=36809 RepID=UPI0009A5DEF6|nr:hypothetical protein [Mycobacteroides abscessus]SLH38286.1 Uncharacterised protein [Mycobacteroides abscessus subsp. massiliense]